MRYFSGFCLEAEEALFEPYLLQSDFTVAGFSYGAIKAAQYAFTCKERIDTLQLFSPAFFQDLNMKFKKLQTLSFSKNSDAYCDTFFKNLAYEEARAYFKKGSLEELETLLHHTWSPSVLEALHVRGIKIEVYLGKEDSIINALTCKDFFLPFSTVYYFKHLGHCLR